MLNVYISYAPDDWRQLSTLLQWLRPLEEQYFLRIWFNHSPPQPPELPTPWNYIFFWYHPARSRTPYHPDLPEKASEAHIYLFLTSYKSLLVPYIEQLEIPLAVDHYTAEGDQYVRIFPILLSPSHWQKHSRLAGFKPLGTGRSLAEIQPPEQGYLQITESLRGVIETLRRNWMERYRIEGLPLDEFHQPAPPPLPEGNFVTLPGWAGWLVILLILLSVTNWYTTHCRWLPVTAEPQDLPEPEYLRENRYEKPAPVPQPWPPDSEEVKRIYSQ